MLSGSYFVLGLNMLKQMNVAVMEKNKQAFQTKYHTWLWFNYNPSMDK